MQTTSGSDGDEDFADMALYLDGSDADARMKAAYSLDRRALEAGQMSVEEFQKTWSSVCSDRSGSEMAAG